MIVILTSFSKNNLTPRQPMRCSWCSFSRFSQCFCIVQSVISALQFQSYLRQSERNHIKSCIKPNKRRLLDHIPEQLWLRYQFFWSIFSSTLFSNRVYGLKLIDYGATYHRILVHQSQPIKLLAGKVFKIIDLPLFVFILT